MAAKQLVVDADVVVFASPTFKATYTGLLKLFLDQFGAGSCTRRWPSRSCSARPATTPSPASSRSSRCSPRSGAAAPPRRCSCWTRRGRRATISTPGWSGAGDLVRASARSGGSRDRDRWPRRALRPLRRRDRRRSLPDLPPAAGRGAALPQRAARLLRPQPLRRRRALACRPRDLHLRAGRDPRADQGRHRDAARGRDLRGSADPHDLPQAPVADVHARRRSRRWSRRSASSPRGASTRSSAPTASTSSPSSARRCRCARSACCWGSPRRTRSRSATRPTRSLRTERRRADEGLLRSTSPPAPRSRSTSTGGADHPSDDIMTELLNVEFDRRARDAPAVDPPGAAHLRERRRRCRQRDHEPADRLDRQGAGRASRPAPRDPPGPLADPGGHRGDPALRASGAPRRPLHVTRRRALRRDRAGGQRRAAPGRLGEPGRSEVRQRRHLRHPPRRRPRTSRSGTARTSASVRRSHASRAASPSTRS